MDVSTPNKAWKPAWVVGISLSVMAAVTAGLLISMEPLPTEERVEGCLGGQTPTELFLLSCPHCMALERVMAQNQLSDATLRRQHIVFDERSRYMARVAFAAQTMNLPLTPFYEAFTAPFSARVEGVALDGSLTELGVAPEAFKKRMTSPGADVYLRRGMELAQSCQIKSVPVIVVQDRILRAASGDEAGHQDLLGRAQKFLEGDLTKTKNPA